MIWRRLRGGGILCWARCRYSAAFLKRTLRYDAGADVFFVAAGADGEVLAGLPPVAGSSMTSAASVEGDLVLRTGAHPTP